MIVDYDKDFGKDIDFDIEFEKSFKVVLSFLHNELQRFCSDNKSRVINLSEDRITQKLVVNLCRNNIRLPFVVIQQNIEEDSIRSVDIGFYFREKRISDKAFFLIEAKKLPSPSRDRETEYLYGLNNKGKITGGIERFKRELHGKNLKKCGMLGYIGKDTFEYWCSLINGWITDLSKNNTDKTIIWSDSEILVEETCENNIATYKSINIRKESCITLYHFWLMLIE